MATWRRSGLRFPEGRGPGGLWAKESSQLFDYALLLLYGHWAGKCVTNEMRRRFERAGVVTIPLEEYLGYLFFGILDS